MEEPWSALSLQTYLLSKHISVKPQRRDPASSQAVLNAIWLKRLNSTDMRGNIVKVHTLLKGTPGEVTLYCFGSNSARFHPSRWTREEISTPPQAAASVYPPACSWRPSAMSLPVTNTEICSDNVKAFRGFGQLSTPASFSLHSNEDGAHFVCV